MVLVAVCLGALITPEVACTAFVSFFFFLSCFAINEPEVLLWAVKEVNRSVQRFWSPALQSCQRAPSGKDRARERAILASAAFPRSTSGSESRQSDRRAGQGTERSASHAQSLSWVQWPDDLRTADPCRSCQIRPTRQEIGMTSSSADLSDSWSFHSVTERPAGARPERATTTRPVATLVTVCQTVDKGMRSSQRTPIGDQRLPAGQAPSTRISAGTCPFVQQRTPPTTSSRQVPDTRAPPLGAVRAR